MNSIFKIVLSNSEKTLDFSFSANINMNVMNVFRPLLAHSSGGAAMSRAVWLVAFVLVVVGAVNWGLVGLAQFDLVATLFGGSAVVLSRIVYSLVGLAGLLAVMEATSRTAPASSRTSPVMRSTTDGHHVRAGQEREEKKTDSSGKNGFCL
jgi:uncharacterized membrane protein YuzA (DUF378 family)